MIKEFTGRYHWLSNFYMGGGCLPSVEHQFQAMKAVTPEDAIKVMAASSPGTAKQLGRTIVLRGDWEEVKDDVMLHCVRMKFEDDRLRQLLLRTGTAYLEEGNNWNDDYWGTVEGRGDNVLGKILMQVRGEIMDRERS